MEMGLDIEFERKLLLVNHEIRKMGFGKFQWAITILCGTGWAVDNIIFQSLSMSLPQIKLEFQSSTPVQFMTFSLYVGLLFGAVIWGIGSDVIGRRLSWLLTLLIGSVFMTAVGGAPSFAATGVLLAFAGIGIGGSLPVDGALLIEFLPGAKQWVLTLLSFFWSLGYLFAGLCGWALISNFRCADDPCPKESNMGWRYLFFTTGGFSCFLWILRFFIYPVPESPKWLLGRGRYEEVIEALDFIAKQNKTVNTLTVEHLLAGAKEFGNTPQSSLPVVVKERSLRPKEGEKRLPKCSPSIWRRLMPISLDDLSEVRRNLKQYDKQHMKLLFATPRMARNTILIMFCWSCIGLAYPLYNAFIAIYIAESGGNQGVTTQSEQYRQLVIFAVLGIPGSLLATLAVELPRLGRRGAMAFFTCLTGCCLFGFTTAKTPNQVLAWNCGISLCQNAMYAILYAMTYECFPSLCRGAGDGLAMSVQRVFGILPTFIAAYGASKPTTPVFVSASLFIVASFSMLFLPFETRGLEPL
ncbi:MFS general substrate transporter [Meira miltonrushii]|uniref:MFS general substrate transporter n=1 Tax=Meira miltonrushii TaxID=1280837 RepID=A0A316V9P9_9BASI|nr:MFS general substrate transporter [Meira miltonrushii]PWN33778.1 MFS general substrate transporter [Meira miltonrushii]